MNKLIAHHLGMGDHIVHCGLVRHIYKRDVRKYDTIFILCYRHNAENVKRMYEGLNKIELLIIDNENEIGTAIDNFVGDKEDFHLDQQGYELYNQIGDDAFFENKKYDKKLRKEFQVKRDLKKELEHFNNYASSHTEYIFVHDDLQRGYEIKNFNHSTESISVSMSRLNLFHNCITGFFISTSNRICINSCSIQNLR